MKLRLYSSLLITCRFRGNRDAVRRNGLGSAPTTINCGSPTTKIDDNHFWSDAAGPQFKEARYLFYNMVRELITGAEAKAVGHSGGIDYLKARNF